MISDYLGTPVEAYDGDGKKVWERELDIYGRIKPGRKDADGRRREEIGERNFIPFRFPGQYEDEETGLYDNRFRYYDPQLGQYTQQDPIGLAGGNPTIYGYVKDVNIWVDVLGLNIVEHFADFDAALKRAFELATGGDSTVTFDPTKYDPLTGTEVEFIGSNMSEIAFDAPHADMNPQFGHDKPHIGVRTAGKRKNGGAKRYNLTYEGEQHPYRTSTKGRGKINCY